MVAADERTNLLPGNSSGPLEEAPLPPKPSGVDPQDLTPSTRAGILAGIWIATFLAALNSEVYFLNMCQTLAKSLALCSYPRCYSYVVLSSAEVWSQAFSFISFFRPAQ